MKQLTIAIRDFDKQCPNYMMGCTHQGTEHDLITLGVVNYRPPKKGECQWEGHDMVRRLTADRDALLKDLKALYSVANELWLTEESAEASGTELEDTLRAAAGSIKQAARSE